MPRDTSYRVLLPADVEPEHYDLTLEPDLEKFFFDGTVAITVDVKVATDIITVHTKELVVFSGVFKPLDAPETSYDVSEITNKVKEMTTSFGFTEPLPVGKGVLTVKFRGILNDQMAGFYRSQYTDSKGEKKFMATTQFEAIDARRCFPCWDEPARKAVFVVTLIFPNGLTALSNMSQSSSEIRKDGKRVETYMPTPKMSTYLLAFCIGDYEYIGGKTNTGVLCRVYCCPGSISRCKYGLQCMIRALEFYNEFFGVPYPLPKMDMIAIPDFAAGAMENWGLVTYREVALLCDEKTVSATQKQRICSVVAHELAHQWFGNLVTMGWWDDLWLNEGFANWMQTFVSDKLHPEWNLWEAYVGMEQQNALSLDALRSSHPIQVPIKKAQEVEEVFDAISYCKGGSVVRMIYAVLGEENFQKGLQIYFKRHAYSNTETTDLWKAWSEASGKDIESMMTSWTSQMGFPVVKVASDPFEGGSKEIEVTQSWFLADGSKQAGDEDKKWVVPLLMGSGKKATKTEFVETPTAKVNCGDVLNGSSFLKLNCGQHVPIRVQYPSSMLKRFSSDLNALAAEDRIGLLSDTFALTKAGAIDPIELATLLKGFTAESNDKVWAELGAVFGGVGKIIQLGIGDDSLSEAFVSFAGKLFGAAFAQVGWDTKASDDDNTKKLRSNLISCVAKYCYKDKEVVAEAKKRFQAFIADPNDPAALSADIRTAVLSIVMKAEGSQAVFDQLIAAHNEAKDGTVRISIYGALGEAPTLALKQKALQWCLTDEVRSQDLIYLPREVATSGKEGGQAVFDWVKTEFDAIYARLGTTSMILFQHMVRISGAGFVTADKADEVAAFWKGRNKLAAMVEKTLGQTVEGIKSTSAFVDRFKKSPAASASAWA
eukprot:CAMPEP_0206429112 /NCGR_PEP_ID=MMETSP0324_2-20121206/6049_1 /ASSEMBLY_ACC=CAM_ASM_000836 /TAXON_ID=2866 /ORGANISM="Crypthecodinium cohnii, Strain Seligo" /LENGTH=882 /DNA_ID=CAMNT_0053894735 /DNA_START=32 /DNA_END=2680 /DNA_ORIENTATION=+